ncbi:MAG: 3-phosphoshikimate 1-carboxyvinyltransferase [Anaerolineales bacterium]
MNLVAVPGNSLTGAVRLPGDKSISHRAALFAALSSGENRAENILVAGVTQVMLEALSELGIEWKLTGTTLQVRGAGLLRSNKPEVPVQLECGNSGTTMRLLAGAVAALGLPAVLDGSDRLRSRPMDRIVEPLKQMGVDIQASPDGTAPLFLAARPPGNKLKSLDYALPVASAQVKSCLLLAALAAEGETRLVEPGPSRDHTERMLRAMGVIVGSRVLSPAGYGSEQIETWLIPPKPLELDPISMVIPGDFSSAAFLVVAALVIPGSHIELQGVGLNPTRTGLLDVLQDMGADITVTERSESCGEPLGNLKVRYSQLTAIEVSGSTVVRMIDEFPVFAIAAAHAQGQTMVSQAEELRYKESDRIHDLCCELCRLGAGVEETRDGFKIQGGRKLDGGQVASHGDHRLAMALAVGGLAATNPVEIKGAGIISESFPQFMQTLKTLGADLRAI